MTTEQKKFIESIASAVKKYAPDYSIKVYSPIIAQAINESGWGKSSLAAKYHNYFGMKCGSAWTGKSVNMTTQEEYTTGTLTTIKDNFRVYDSLDEGVKGYFDFISISRYANLKGVTDPETYLKNIKADGYATSSTYVSNLMSVIKSYSLTSYDNGGASESTTTATTGSSGQVETTYIVVKGDTLSGIAAKYGTTYQKLAEYNGISDPNKIYVGQTIKIPGSTTSTSTKSDVVYTVVKGDTLSGIAAKYGTTYQKLAEYNGISDPNKIYVGQKIEIPQ